MKLEELQSIITAGPDFGSLWEGRYKIPWDDPDFSRRMLDEHLSQSHDLASRKLATINKQVAWINEHVCDNRPRKILDLGCGPGFYLSEFVKRGHSCCGIDFSPASIEYAQNNIEGDCRLLREDLRTAEFGSGYDIAAMLYGELNVFSPEECAKIIRKAADALVTDGWLLLEVQTYDSVKKIGQSPNTWYKSEAGLFSDKPHICLIENHWSEDQSVTVQCFYIINAKTGTAECFRSTTLARREEEYHNMLSEAGFRDIEFRVDWLSGNDDLLLLTARS